MLDFILNVAILAGGIFLGTVVVDYWRKQQ